MSDGQKRVPGSAVGRNGERRREQRQVTVRRVGLVHTDEGEELCLVRNISADGLMARVYRQFRPGEKVGLELKSDSLLAGTIAWANHYEIGVEFDAPIDVADVLAARWAGEAQQRPRLPRLELDCPAILRQGAKSQRARVCDISLRGAKIRAPAPVAPSAQIVLTLPDLPCIHGVVRWAHGGEAGLLFNECLPFEVLARWAEDHRRGARGCRSAEPEPAIHAAAARVA